MALPFSQTLKLNICGHMIRLKLLFPNMTIPFSPFHCAFLHCASRVFSDIFLSIPPVYPQANLPLTLSYVSSYPGYISRHPHTGKKYAGVDDTCGSGTMESAFLLAVSMYYSRLAGLFNRTYRVVSSLQLMPSMQRKRKKG